MVLCSLYQSLFWELRDKGNFKQKNKILTRKPRSHVSNVAYWLSDIFKNEGAFSATFLTRLSINRLQNLSIDRDTISLLSLCLFKKKKSFLTRELYKQGKGCNGGSDYANEWIVDHLLLTVFSTFCGQI